MQDDSGTESESDHESSLVGWIDLSSSAPASSSGTADRKLGEQVTKAIETLRDIELGEIMTVNPEQTHRKILEASEAINEFLDGVTRHRQDAVEELQLFASLVQPCFFSVLFAQRKVFHNVAARTVVPGTFASTIISWVDGVLAKLAEATIVIACGSSYNHAISEAMRAQIADDSLRAASQLPEKWIMVPRVISHNQASPAAKRLAIRLAFAVYILGPRLQRYDPWNDPENMTATDILKIMEEYALSASVNGPSIMYSTEPLVKQTRITHAMVITLFAASDFELHKLQTGSPFRPRTLSGLLDMIQLVLCPTVTVEEDSCIMPCECLDSAQILLLQWGKTVRWCWETWNDSRIANTEYITRLTATWLYHSQCNSPAPYQNIPQAYALLEESPYAANAIAQVLHQGMALLLAAQPGSVPETWLTVLSKSCQAINHLLKYDLLRGKISISGASTCKCLLGLFLLLHFDSGSDRQLDVKSSILESLTLIDEQTFDDGLSSICEDSKVRFEARVNELILQCRRTLTQTTETVEEPSRTKFEEIRSILYFLLRIWHSNPHHVHRQPVLNLLSSLTNLLLKDDTSHLLSISLRDAVVTTFCMLDSDLGTPIKSPKQDDIWSLALDAGCSNLVSSASFAHHILTTERLLDPLRCAEAWDHLRDTLVLILRHYFIQDEEPVALLVSCMICGALIRLLGSDQLTVQFILNSPWTMSFCAELKKLLGGSGSDGGYGSLLKKQLTPVSDTLLDVIRSKSASDNGAATVQKEITRFQSRLVYHVQHSDYSLILVPRTP